MPDLQHGGYFFGYGAQPQSQFVQREPVTQNIIMQPGIYSTSERMISNYPMVSYGGIRHFCSEKNIFMLK